MDSANTEETHIRVSISSLYRQIVQTFALLKSAVVDSGSHIIEQLPPSVLDDELGRFRVWAGNSGAHRTGKISLDHKLRYASHVHDKVTEYLRQIARALNSGIYWTSALI